MIPEPPDQPLLQSGHCLGERFVTVVLEDQAVVVERTGHETGFFSPPDLDPTALPNPIAYGGKLPASIGRSKQAGRSLFTLRSFLVAFR